MVGTKYFSKASAADVSISPSLELSGHLYSLDERFLEFIHRFDTPNSAERPATELGHVS